MKIQLVNIDPLFFTVAWVLLMAIGGLIIYIFTGLKKTVDDLGKAVSEQTKLFVAMNENNNAQGKDIVELKNDVRRLDRDVTVIKAKIGVETNA